MPRKVPRKFNLHFGSGVVAEEATYSGEHHEPTIQLLDFTEGEAAGTVLLRFCSYNRRGQFMRDPMLLSDAEIDGLREALRDATVARTPEKAGGMMAGRLHGKVAIVTGAGSQNEGIGNGRAMAVLMAREGAKVLLVDRRMEAAELTARMITEAGGEAVPFEADVTDEQSAASMTAEAVRRWRRLDILVNNVGIGVSQPVSQVTREQWDLQMTVNVTSMVLASKPAIPAMIEGGGGAILNISSIASRRGGGLAPYAASKGAVEALTRAMAADHGRQGIRVNAIAPGPLYTPMVYARGMADEVRERRRRATVLGTEGTAWDIGWAAVFLCSDEARWVTGVVLPVDGGVLVK